MKNKMFFINYESLKLSTGVNKFVAASKARDDVKSIVLSREGVIYKPVFRKYVGRISGGLELFLKLVLAFLKVSRGTCVFIQYPMISIKAFNLISLLFPYYKVSAIIHDLPSYRLENEYKNRRHEIVILNRMDHIIVHSEEMKRILQNDGVKCKITTLGLFDYLLDEKQQIKKEKNTIVFAGDLGKSLFLKDLHKVCMDKLSFNLYGKEAPAIKPCEKIIYKGAFCPDVISDISGEWGLLWDGNSIDTCNGNFGDYLKIIAPHKFSLYIACGLKIVVWEKSAMAQFVREKYIGIEISSLNQICEKINSLSKEQLEKMEHNVQLLSKDIRKGNALGKCLDVVWRELE